VDTELLRTFLEVQKTRHFGKAAEQLFLTQSAVSFRIRQLEQQLGVVLFHRHRNNIQLTSAGEQLVNPAEQILRQVQQARQQLLPHQQRQEYFRLGISLALRLSLGDGLQQAVPEPLTMELQLGSAAELLQQFHHAQLDAVLLLQCELDADKRSANNNSANTDCTDLEIVAQQRLLPVASVPHARLHSEQSKLSRDHTEFKLSWPIALPRLYAEATQLQSPDAGFLLAQLLQRGRTHQCSAYLPEITVQHSLRQKQLSLLDQPVIHYDIIWLQHAHPAQDHVRLWCKRLLQTTN
jgi:DNA-binding transcriptional LysR family regulator